MKLALSLLSLMLLASCSSASIKRTDAAFNATAETTSEKLALQSEQLSLKQKSTPAFRLSDGIYLGGHTIKPTRNSDLPAIFNNEVIQNHRFSSLRDAAAWVRQLSGLPVRISPEVLSASSGQGAQAISATLESGTALSATASQPMRAVFAGSFAAFLDVIAAHYSTHWKFVDDSIEFYNIETKTFLLKAVPSTQINNSSISALASSGNSVGSISASSASGGTNSQTTGAASTSGSGMGGTGSPNGSNTSASSTLNVWVDVPNAIRHYLSPQGRVVPNISSGTITVSDFPENVAKAGEYIRQINERMTLQAMFQVKVLMVSVSDSDVYGINWNAVYKKVNNEFGITATSSFAGGVGAGAYAFNVLSGNAEFNGTSAIINALSSQGKVSTVTSVTLSTLNNLPIPYTNGGTVTYMAQSSSTLSTVGVTTSVQPGTFDTGFNMNLLPNIFDLQHMILQFNLSLNTLRSMTTVTNGSGSGSSSLQAPDVGKVGSMQYVQMKSGETLILSGFEQKATNASSQGVGSASNYLLGGGKSSKSTKDVMVVLITPYISQNN